MYSFSHRGARCSFSIITVVILIACFASGTASAQAEAQEETAPPKGPDRGGFTLLLTMGLGWQSNDMLDESTKGLGGLNLGIGGFLDSDLALMFRISGTNVRYYDIGPMQTDVDVVSGVGGVSVQFWPSDYVNLEAGGGFGFANSDPGTQERGWGLILGVGLSFFHRGKNSLQVGVEYAPVFLETGPDVTNLSFAFGWQLL